MSIPGVSSLRWRLVAVMCIAYVVVTTVTAIAAYTSQRETLYNQLDIRARNDARILAAGSVANLTSGNLGTLQTFVSSLARAQGVSYAAVTSSDGHILAATRRQDIGKRVRLPAVTQPRAIDRPGNQVQGLAPIVETTELGQAEVVLETSSVAADLRNALVLSILTRLLGFLLFLFLALVVAQYILGPLATLARAASAIRHGDLSARMTRGGGAELTTVADTFNEMARSLEQRIQNLSFLAWSGQVLPSTFRDRKDAREILESFCQQTGAVAAGLMTREEEESPTVWYGAETDGAHWRPAVLDLVSRVERPQAEVIDGVAVMAVPVLGKLIFATARPGETPFSQEEQQVIMSFAYQVGVAADNARLFDEQQDALQVKDQFLSIVSHELRTPLTAIKGYAQLAVRQLEGQREARRFLDHIENQANRLSRLVDELLDVTRFVRGQFELSRERMDARPLIEEVVGRFEVTSPRHTFRLDLHDGAYQGYWDRDRLDQVLTNLIGNAVKYSPDGGEIEVSSRREGGQLVVAVKDQGIGIPPEDQERLFDRFYRSRETGDAPGLGLGLYVTRRIVEAHRGTISVRSAPGEGSEFEVRLPLARQPVSAPSV